MNKDQEAAAVGFSNRKTGEKGYNHKALERKRNFLRFLIREIGFNLLVKLDKVEGLENVPLQGPLILMINHIAFIDPIVVLHVMPRNIVPMAKVEAYEYPLIGIFPRLWEVIPVRRQEVDRRAVQMALEVLRAGEVILVAPEGTRGSQLQRGKEGVAYLGSRSGAPILPVAVTDTPGFPTLPFSRRWRGPGAHVSFGRPFHFCPEMARASREELRVMTDEAMYQLAALLPENLRGAYRDLDAATSRTIETIDIT
jgi:1-acyl-sn-glycerol-3-phosphate acyltransferase